MSTSDLNTLDVYLSTREWASQQGFDVCASECIGSTNTEAKNDFERCAPLILNTDEKLRGPRLYLARVQTAGRGRSANTWISSLASSLYSSWVFQMARVPQPILSPLVGLALFKACRRTWPEIPFNLKAPNDLFIDRLKVGGILIETVDSIGAISDRRTIVGLGMNVAGRPDGVPTATSLWDELASAPNFEHPERELNQTKWRLFLSHWIEALRSALVLGQNDRLDAESAEDLRQALNLHPLLKSPVLKIDELAQIYSANGVMRWSDL